MNAATASEREESLAYRALRLAKLVATTLAALVAAAKGLGLL